MEKRQLEEWLAMNQENKNEFNDIKLLWETSAKANQSRSIENDFFIGLTQIKNHFKVKQSRRRQSKIIMGVCGLFVLTIVVIYAMRFPTRNQTDHRLLNFNNTSLVQVISILEDVYEVDIEINKKEVLECRFTGSFYHTQNIDVVLNALDKALNLKHDMAGTRRYKISGLGCSKQPSNNQLQ